VSLKQTAVQEDFQLAELKQVLTACHFPGGTAKCHFHQGIPDTVAAMRV
jgi:hypothetical protein